MSIHDPIFTESTDYTFIQTEPKRFEIKNNTDKLIFEFLAKNNTGKTREQISKELDLPRSSIFDSLNRLHLMNWIEIDFKIKSKSKKGRPSTLYFLKTITQGNKR